MTELIYTHDAQPNGVEPESEIKLGQWYWITNKDDDDNDEPDRWLGCVVHVGSNYVGVKNVAKYPGTRRIHFSKFDDIATHEPDPVGYIQQRVARNQHRVRELMNEIQTITAMLGVVPREQIDSTAQTTTTLATLHGQTDVKAHKSALIQAKNVQLPALFKQIEAEHEEMAVWMRAELHPAEAQLGQIKGVTKIIENRIFSVELYAGLIEDLTCVKKGKPAKPDEKIRIFQRRHYMDEECLYAYEAGGMEFNDIKQFDKWLCRTENLNRILPFERCVVAFRVRRDEKQREFDCLTDYIQFVLSGVKNWDKITCLYIRNGQRVYRLITEIDFDEELFPDDTQPTVFGGGDGDLWLYMPSSLERVITQHAYDGIVAADIEYQAKVAQEDREYRAAMQQFNALSKEDQDKAREPRSPWHHRSSEDDPDNYEPLTKDHLYYDDAMDLIAKAATKHNRIAVVLQGLLDRSEAFQPHPPIKLWQSHDFQQFVSLHYDSSKAITGSAPLDFEEYRRQLNKSLKVGCVTVGQQHLWMAAEAVKENDRRHRDWRNNSRDRFPLKTFRPHGNPGPGRFAKVASISRKGMATFEWTREYKRADSWHEADKPIPTVGSYPVDSLLNASAYTAGDFKLFYADPRTRAEYIQWAPFLLAAEDFANGKIDKE